LAPLACLKREDDAKNNNNVIDHTDDSEGDVVRAEKRRKEEQTAGKACRVHSTLCERRGKMGRRPRDQPDSSRASMSGCSAASPQGPLLLHAELSPSLLFVFLLVSPSARARPFLSLLSLLKKERRDDYDGVDWAHIHEHEHERMRIELAHN
jgi:hypothetical protein